MKQIKDAPFAVKASMIFLILTWIGWVLHWAATNQVAIIVSWLTGFTILAGIIVGMWLFFQFIDWMDD